MSGSDPIGASPGSLEPLEDANIKNEYDSIPDQSLDAIAARTQPREIASGVQRGTQTIMNVDGSYVTMGLIPDGGTDFGIGFFAADGTIISKSTASTQFYYDATTGKNIMQIGLLPDGTYGWAVASVGKNVSDGF